eukprot:CAMPEP_0168548750 /NCGR_PEP_ID=MMETSP0413-20121227/4735_1 /TAXON_ID=136452 /ORGANISM="Filamoeba nolandi, Strain NC-AS-23-1" /LENGTH=482 /DNA_ID=CAMNT_0008579089 /DNA_START=82 /DNA_END=1530 /DNA_ORIENTATION=+
MQQIEDIDALPDDWSNIGQLLPDDLKLSDYFVRDLAAMNTSNPDPLLAFDEETTNILEPLVRCTTELPQTNYVIPSNDVFNQYPQEVTQIGNPYLAPNDLSSDTSSSPITPFASYSSPVSNYSTVSPTQIQNNNTHVKVKKENPPVAHTGKRNQAEQMFYLPPELQTPQQVDLDSEFEADTKRTKNGAPVEKAEKRKQQTRNASKLYRQRKKALEAQLNERLNALEEEKRILLNEQKNAEIMLRKLKDENERLKKNYQVSSEETKTKRLDLLKKLESQVVNKADENTISMTIAEINECCRKCMDLGKCSLNQLISPATVGQLVDNGFFEDKSKVETLARKGSLANLVEKLQKEIKSLNQEQLDHLNKELQAHHSRLEVIYKEREELTQRITVHFRELKNSKSDFSKFLETLSCLEHLRKSLEDEAQEWTRSMQAMLGGTLSPLQMAQFLLKVEFQHASVCQLNTVWSSLNKNWACNKLSVAE